MNYGRITLGMQKHLAQQIVEFSSIRSLARAKGLSAKTVMSALKAAAADTQLHQVPIDTLAVRSLTIGKNTYWLAIHPSTLNTVILVEGNDQPALTDLVGRIVDFSPSQIDLPINPELATRLKAILPRTRLTVSVFEVYDLTEEILERYVKRIGFRLRNEGLKYQRAIRLSSTRSDSLTEEEQLLFRQLSARTPFWSAYKLKELLHSRLEAENVTYMQAMQEAIEQTIEVVRPLFLPAYLQLVLLDKLGVDTQRSQEYQKVHQKLKRLRERLRQQGTRFEFPLLGAIFLLFMFGFGRSTLPQVIQPTLVEMRDIFLVPSSFWLSAVERRAILLT